MKNIKSNLKLTAIIVLLALGACAIVFGNNIKIQGGLGGLLWGFAMVIVTLIAKQKNEQEMADFDMGAELILRDVAENQEESESFGYNIEMFNKARKKMEKKHRKQFFAFCALTVVMFVVAIVAFV